MLTPKYVETACKKGQYVKSPMPLDDWAIAQSKRLQEQPLGVQLSSQKHVG